MSERACEFLHVKLWQEILVSRAIQDSRLYCLYDVLVLVTVDQTKHLNVQFSFRQGVALLPKQSAVQADNILKSINVVIVRLARFWKTPRPIEDPNNVKANIPQQAEPVLPSPLFSREVGPESRCVMGDGHRQDTKECPSLCRESFQPHPWDAEAVLG